MPLAIFAVFVSVLFGMSVVTSALQIWFEPVGGFVLAAAWVITAYLTAADYKIITALMAFAAGTALACRLLGYSWWPEGYDKAYEPTFIPFAATLAGGILAVLASVWNDRWRRPHRMTEKCDSTASCEAGGD